MTIPTKHNLFSPGTRIVISNILWLLIDRFLRSAIGLFIGAWVARYLGPEEYGIFSYAYALVFLFSACANLGLDNIVVRELVTSPSKKAEILASAFVLKLVGATLSCTILYSISSLLVADSSTLFIVLIMSLSIFFQSADTVDLWFQSQLRSKYTVYAKNSAFLITCLIKVILILRGASLSAFAWATFAETLIASLALLTIYCGQEHNIISWKFNTKIATVLLKDSWPLVLSGLLIILFMRLDQIMLGQLADMETVGFYSAAVRLVEILVILPSLVLTSLYPKLIAFQTDKARLLQIYALLFRFFFLFSCLLILSIWLWGERLVVLMYGTNYTPTTHILSILVCSTLFTFSGNIRSQIFFIENLKTYHIYSALLGVALLIPLNYLLIPLYGGVGAASSTVICYFISSILTSFIFSKLRYIGYMQINLVPLRKALWKRNLTTVDTI